MKKTIIIILAVVLILVGGIWLYLLLFGTPDSSDDIFANLGFGDNDPVVVTPPTPLPPAEPVVVEPVITNYALRLLTTRPVAGAIIIGTSTANQKVRFVEQGVGHIYEIDLNNSDSESQLINKTKSKVSNAFWSDDGEHVVLLVEGNINRSVTLINLNNPDTEIELPPDAENIAFLDDNETLHYTRTDNEGTLGYSYSLSNESSLVIFSTPFTSMSVLWGEEPIVYNRPSEFHPGYVYKIDSNGSLDPQTTGGVGLTAFRTESHLAVNRLVDGKYKGYVVERENPDSQSAIAVMPEKCAAAQDGSSAWCGYPFGRINGQLPNDWYKGKITLNDSLWLVNLNFGEAVFVANLSEISQLNIDITQMQSDFTRSRLTFIDKATRNLWFYDSKID